MCEQQSNEKQNIQEKTHNNNENKLFWNIKYLFVMSLVLIWN